MRAIRHKLNIFTVILTMIVLASILQLDFLRDTVISRVNITDWVQHSLWNTQSTACTTNCGTGITKSQAYEPEHIQIASVKIDLPVIPVPLKNGTWDVLPGVANYAQGTSLINDKEGNVGIFGHAQSNAFQNLLKIKEVATIIITGKGFKATYKVVKIEDVKPSQVDVFYPTKTPVLTLITCDGAYDIHRLMVRAKLVRLEKESK